jgi:hypothetical protein
VADARPDLPAAAIELVARGARDALDAGRVLSKLARRCTTRASSTTADTLMEEIYATV